TLAVLVLALIAIPMGVALAKQIGRVTISGPGLDKPIEISDHDLANQLGPGQLDNFEASVSKPAQPGDTYFTIDRDYLDETGTVIASDHLRYYPDAATGHGLILYEGMDNGGESSNTGRWFKAGASGEAVLLKILAENGVALAV